MFFQRRELVRSRGAHRSPTRTLHEHPPDATRRGRRPRRSRRATGGGSAHPRASAADARRPRGPPCRRPTPARNRRAGSRAMMSCTARSSTGPPGTGCGPGWRSSPGSDDGAARSGTIPGLAGPGHRLERGLPADSKISLEPRPSSLLQPRPGSSASTRPPVQPLTGIPSCRARSSKSSLDRRVRHQQLASIFAAGRPGLDGPPGHVEVPRGRGRPLHAAPARPAMPISPPASVRPRIYPDGVSPASTGILTPTSGAGHDVLAWCPSACPAACRLLRATRPARSAARNRLEPPPARAIRSPARRLTLPLRPPGTSTAISLPRGRTPAR